jgi:hypothetical protein
MKGMLKARADAGTNNCEIRPETDGDKAEAAAHHTLSPGTAKGFPPEPNSDNLA